MDIFGILDPDRHENLCGSETLVGYYRHACGQRYSNAKASQRFQLAPPDYMMLPCTSTSMHPLANSVITSGTVRVTSVKFSKVFYQMATSGLELTTPGSTEKHLNLLSHGGVLISSIQKHFIRNKVYI